jgi:hypothetical protein
VDGREILAHAWVSPADALAGPFAQHLMTPARATLQALEPLRSVGEALSWAAGLTKITCMQPRLAMAGTGLCSIAPGHPAFDEVAKLDPEGVGNAWCEFKAGEPVRIGTRTERITDTAGSNRYRVQMDDGRWVDVPVDATHVVGADRIVIAPGRSTLAVELRECADWLAPERGFLARIGR